ncbi:MAG: hypothetical protein V4580_19720 [Bacteroidota bacterium]
MKFLLPTTLAFCFLFNNLQAQDPNWQKIKLAPPLFHSDSVIGAGVELHKAKKYDEAIIEYAKVHENDSNYVLAQYETILSYMALKKDSAAIILCDHVAFVNRAYHPTMMLLKANCYDNLKQFDKSKALYMEGVKQYPYSAKFYHEYAISCFNQKKYQEAHDNYINAIRINPQYAPSHFQLGMLALKQKKIIPAMLSFQYYLLLDNSSARAKSVIDVLEKIGDDAVKYEDLAVIEPLDQNDDFSDLESIVKSKAALSSKFKSKVKLNFRLLKQIQVVLDKIEYNAEDKGFYNQFYAKFFKDMASKDLTEVYLYSVLSGVEVEDASNWVKGHKADMDKLKNWYADYMKPYNEVSLKENTSGNKAYKIYQYNEIIAIGSVNAREERSGYWNFLYAKTAILKSEGNFDDKGEKTGQWKFYYEDGVLKEKCSFKNNKLDGEYIKFHNNGKMIEHLFYKDGKYDGVQTVYYSNGNIKNVYTYKNNVQDGEESGYYRTGKLAYKSDAKNNSFNGLYTSYYENGSVKKTYMFTNGVKAGQSKEYFNHPKDQVYGEGNYENNFATGEWKYYFDDGKLSLAGMLNKKGQKEGVWKDYLKTGVLIEENTYTDGKSEGISKNFYHDGKIYEEFYYRKSKVNQYKYYSKTGEVVKEISKQKNELNLELYNRNGTVRIMGKMVGEQIDGQLTTYNYLGLKSETTEYKGDEKINSEKTYYPNGQIAAETPYVNNVQHGLFSKYFVSGAVSMKGYYVNDNMEGYWFYYDRGGPLSEIRHYVNGEQVGWQRDFACNGKLQRAERLEDGRIVERCYYDTLGKIIKRVNYDSCNNCEVMIPNIDGKPWIKRTLKNNYINGVSTTFYPTGKPLFESTYDMDLENGLSKSYNIFGKLQSETNYDMDVKQGKYTTYKNEKIQYTATYNNGKATGVTTDYYENGKPFQTTTYEYNDVQGPLTRYDDNGNVAIVLNYINDNLVSYSYEDETGKLVPAIEINKPDMEVKAFYKNKKPSVSFKIKNGEKEGTYVLYSALGTKLLEENYSYGFLNGTRTTYYASGKPKLKSNFNYGDFNGMYLEYNENGTPRTELTYVNDKRHGLCKYYDETGKLLLKSFFYNDYSIKIIP